MQKNNIASKFNVWIIVSICLVVMTLTVLITSYLLHRFSLDVHEKDALHAKGLASAVSGTLDHAFSLNFQLAANPGITNAILNADSDWDKRKSAYAENKQIAGKFAPGGGMPLLTKMKQQYDFAELFFVQDVNGNQVARSHGALGKRSQRWWFKKFIGDGSLKPFFSKSYYSMTGDKPVASAFHAIFDKNRFVGIMGTDINFESLQKLAQNYLSSADLSAIIIDNRGVIIAHQDRNKLRELYNLKKMTKKILVKSDAGGSIQDMTGHHQTVAIALDWDKEVASIAEKALRGKSGFADDIRLDGANCTLHYHPIPLPGSNDMSQNYAVILIRDNASASRTKYTICFFAALIALTAIGILIPLFRIRIKKIILVPLETLASSMRDMEAPDREDITLNTNDEFQLLAETYNSMRRKLTIANNELVTLNKDLEKRIEASTEDLKIANENLHHDITVRKQVEEALRESEELYRKTFETAPDSITITELETGRFLEVNEAFCRLSQFPREETIGKTAYDLKIYDEEGAREKFITELKKHGEIVGFEIKYRRKDGRVYDTLQSAKLLNYGNKNRLISVVTDISHRKRAEAALKESERRYRLLSENAHEAIIIIQDGKAKFPNPKAIRISRMLGLQKSRDLEFDIIHPDDRETIQERYQKRLNGEAIPDYCTFRLLGKSGEELWVELNDVTVSWNGRPAILCFFHDITEQKKLEEQIQAKLRMDAIGTLAGGIAHNFNNLLMGIQGNISLMKLDPATVSAHADELTKAEQCIDSGSNLSKQLLGFARGGKYVVKTLNPNEVVDQTCQIFLSSSKKITVHTDYREDIWAIEADRGQVELVMMNIVVNAGQAMEHGGDLTVKTENVVITAEYREAWQAKPGRFVRISIADTGSGMDEATKGKIFEPFFTTKPIGQGSGLGLSSAFGIVKNHFGFIEVSSKPDQGSQFDIYLPASTKELSPADDAPKELILGSGTILLVDDDDNVIDVCREMLEELGYQVLTANGGKQAIDIYHRDRDRINLVILDLTMPGMDGEEVYQHLTAFNPDIKVIIATGHDAETYSALAATGEKRMFIQKPFDIVVLSKTIAPLMAAETGSRQPG